MLFQQAELELLEAAASELRQEEDFLRILMEGPPSMTQTKEEALRQKVANALNDGAESGCLELALGELKQSRAAAVESARLQAKQTLLEGEAFGRLPHVLVQVMAKRDKVTIEMERIRLEAQKLLLNGCMSGRLEETVAAMQARNRTDSESVCSASQDMESVCSALEKDECSTAATTDVESTADEAEPKDSDEPVRRISLDEARAARLKESFMHAKLSRATMTKKPKTTNSDQEQMALQAKTARLEASTFGFVKSKMIISPSKGKKVSSPKKGGS